MAFISLVALLFIEQLLPLNQQRWVRAPLYRVADFVELHTNAGERWHAVAAWMVVVVGAELGTYRITTIPEPPLPPVRPHEDGQLEPSPPLPVFAAAETPFAAVVLFPPAPPVA